MTAAERLAEARRWLKEYGEGEPSWIKLGRLMGDLITLAERPAMPPLADVQCINGLGAENYTMSEWDAVTEAIGKYHRALYAHLKEQAGKNECASLRDEGVMDLLPCPFCGGDAQEPQPYGNKYGRFIECKSCHASIWRARPTDKEADTALFVAWNTRVKQEQEKDVPEGNEGSAGERGTVTDEQFAIALYDVLDRKEGVFVQGDPRDEEITTIDGHWNLKHVARKVRKLLSQPASKPKGWRVSWGGGPVLFDNTLDVFTERELDKVIADLLHENEYRERVAFRVEPI